MNTPFESSNLVSQAKPTFRHACVVSCKKLLSKLDRTKQAIFRQFKDAFQVSEPLLRLALNEAEAIAWQTGFPQLIFPTLATEKAEAAVAWQARQRLVRVGA
jgi:hypothetical protein